MIRNRFRSRPAGWVPLATCVLSAWVTFGAGCTGIRVPPPRPGTATLFGTVRLLPHEGLTSASAAGAYGDRALRDAELVSYTKPGFAVVSAVGLASPRGDAPLAIRGSRFGARLVPHYAAVGQGGSITVRNDDDRAHIVSCPAHGLLTRLEPGGDAHVTATVPGEVRWFVLDAGGGEEEAAEASVYVAEGPFTVIAADGTWVLDGLVPPPAEGAAVKPIRLQVWHPRFPPALESIELEPDRAQRIDVELQVR